MSGSNLRIATYNVHKCRGLDGRLRPDRIVRVLREMEADVIALQEVLSVDGHKFESDQPRFLAEQLGFHWVLGENRRLNGGAYGNVVLSRFPLHQHCNYDISVHGRESRGCLRTDVVLGDGHLLHVFNVHLGTSFVERRQQARKLIAGTIVLNGHKRGPRVVLGDFNEWTRGLATRMLSAELESIDIRSHLRKARTYPGIFPFMHLDHIYHDPDLQLQKLTLHRSRTALVASDHLPLIAEFRLSRWTGGHNGSS